CGKDLGCDSGPPRVSRDALRKWKSERVIGKGARGLAGVAKSKGVEIVGGRGVFEDARTVRVEGDEPQALKFRHAIVAVGSAPSPLRGIALSERVMDSTAALEVADIPERLLVVGGGYIGLELGQVYAALGSAVTLVEMTDGLLPGVDRDLVQWMARRVDKQFAAVRLNARLEALRETKAGVEATIAGAAATFDRALIAVGRRPLTDGLGLETTRVKQDARGFIEVDGRCA